MPPTPSALRAHLLDLIRRDLLGPDHLDYVGRMQAAMTALGYKNFFEAIIVQQVHLLSGGEGEDVETRRKAGHT